MKALEILASLYKDVLHWENRGISCTNTSFELKEAIAELQALENDDRLGLNTSEKLRIQLEERLDCSINECQMDLILEYIYDFLSYNQDELEALQSQIKIKDTAINSQRLTIGLLEDELANMQRTHQLTIKSYRKQIEALQAPKTCSSCYHSLIFDNSHRRCSIIYININDDCGDPTAVVPNNFSCGYYEPKDE